MVITTCDKCGKPLEIVAHKHIDIIIDRTSLHSREWPLDFCVECAEIFDLFLDSFKDYKPIFEPSPSSCSEDYSDDEVVNQAVDVWGGAGPDCSSKRVTPVEVKSYNVPVTCAGTNAGMKKKGGHSASGRVGLLYHGC